MFDPTLTFPEVFDSSMLHDLKSCQRLFQLASMDHWKSKTSNVHLHAGGAFAKGVEVTRRAFYEQQLDSEVAIERGVQALLEAYGDFDCPQDSAKSATRMAGALVFYWDNYPLTHEAAFPVLLPGGKRGIEFSFIHPLPIDHPETGNPILYSGRMDGILNYAGGIYVTDEKTTTQLGASWPKQWDLRAQFTGYCWGARQSGIPVAGALIRGVSILKTKYETMESVVPRPEWQIDRWYTELLEWITDAKGWWERGKKQKGFQWRHNLDSHCAAYGGCGFRNICLSQQPQSWLETAFERRYWDPVERKEIMLESPPGG